MRYSRVFLTVCGIVIAAAAPTSDPVVAVHGDESLTASQVRALIASTDPDTRKQLQNSPDALQRVIRDTFLQHAVLASEDERFFEHHGIDWTEVHKVVDQDMDRGKLGRGASSITQQLVKNLFLSTSRSILRKALEFTLAPPADFILGKQRVLELYLNVIEWGPGIYGAEAAANYYYGTPAARVGREQAARLAAVIPSPLTRKPPRMELLSADILERMRNLGW